MNDKIKTLIYEFHKAYPFVDPSANMIIGVCAGGFFSALVSNAMPIIYSAIGTGVSVGLGIFYFRYLSAYSINKTGIGKEQVKEAAYEEAAKLIHERNYEQLDQLCKNYTVVKDSFNILDD